MLDHADVFKTYLMILPPWPLAGKSRPELTNDDLKRLIAIIKTHRLKVAFETGGLRLRPWLAGREDQAGELQAQSELRLLRRWLQAGGPIDYLTTDHAVMMNMRGVGFPGPGLDPNRSSKMTVEELIGELVDYFEQIHRQIPHARFGVIESLGYFNVTAPDGRQYPHTDLQLPQWEFSSFFDHLLAAITQRGLELDHFHIDFGWEGVHYDGRRQGRLDFGRVLAVESYVQSKGVKAGVIINAFHDRAATEITPSEADRQAYQRTLAFFDGYRRAGGRADHLVIQTWQPYPHRTGPEDEPYTVLNIARDILRRAE